MTGRATPDVVANVRGAIEELERLDFNAAADGLMPVRHGRFIRREDVLYLFDLLAWPDREDTQS